MREKHEEDAKMTKHDAKHKIDTQMTQQGTVSAESLWANVRISFEQTSFIVIQMIWLNAKNRLMDMCLFIESKSNFYCCIICIFSLCT